MEKEVTIFDYLPKVLPILDVIFIVWIAFNSPRPWVTTPIHMAVPALGLTALLLFKEKGRLGFYLIGVLSSTPLFFLNCWSSATCPTWLNEFTFIAGGLLLTASLVDRIAVLGFVLFTTIVPMLINNNPTQLIITVVIGELAVWFLLERSVKFIDYQKQQIQKQKHIVEDKQKDILDSIHYAKRIQTALMTNEKYIERKLNELNK
jgi:accessory gene regulator protein AgrB